MFRRSIVAPLMLVLAALALSAQAPPGWVTVRVSRQAPVVSGFASVEPGTAITITATQTGLLTSLLVAPGDSVRPGQVIGGLGGPQIIAALAKAQGARDAADDALSAEQSKFATHLSTKAQLAQAQASAATARATLAALRAAISLRAPAAGQVQTLPAALGAVVGAGQPVAVVQPAAGAWVKAVFYGPHAAALTPGMAARFTPADGAPSTMVRLRGPLGSQADGGVAVAFTGTGLEPGQTGMLTLALPSRAVLMVPSAALILDAGQWWVMVHGPTGDHAVQVVPGEAEGAQTPILSGLTAGDEVIVEDAALLYHRDIAAQYQPPD
jgi:multidrug resistance efflux pump